jgi:CHASE2 domain-containing sensor protein
VRVIWNIRAGWRVLGVVADVYSSVYIICLHLVRIGWPVSPTLTPRGVKRIYFPIATLIYRKT